MSQAGFKNILLRSLSAEVIARLALKRVTFEPEHDFEVPGHPVDSLFFVELGMASMTTAFSDGSEVEVGMFGYDSVIGLAALMGASRSSDRVYAQIAGYGYSSPLESARIEFERCGDFHTLALRYVHSQLFQARQFSACNARHNAEQRLASGLLLCATRLDSMTYALSQDVLATILGSTRPTVSLAAGTLRDDGMIEYSRGVIRIVDTKKLEKKACECYRIIKNHLEALAL